MDFGTNWLKPIQGRLSEKFPSLSEEELNDCDRLCRAVMKAGHAHVIVCWRSAKGNKHKACQLFSQEILQQHSWVSRANMSGLFSQGCYYAHKNALL